MPSLVYYPPMLPDLIPCSIDNSVLEAELRAGIADGSITVSRFDVMERVARKNGTPTIGYYVLVQSPRMPGRYIATRRDRDTPRQFWDFERLNDKLRDLVPDASVQIHRKAKLPPKR